MGDSGEWNAYSSLHNISDRDDGIGKTDNHDRYYGAQHIWQDRHIYQLHSVTLTGWREDRIHEILTADSFDSYNYWYVRALVRHGAWTYLGYIYILYGASDNDKNHLIEGCSETQHWSLANVQGNRYVQCGSKWILVGNNGALYVSSSQTTKPEERTSGTTENLYDAALIDGKIVVVGAHGTMLISSDGTTWTPIDSGTGETLYAIAAK
jgi:hypothetical protein